VYQQSLPRLCLLVIHSEYLDLAAGVAVIFFLCSLAVSGLNEGLNWLTRVRAKFLWAYMHDLFDPRDDPTRGKALPRGFGGIIHLWRRNDVRPVAGGEVQHETVSGPIDSPAWLAKLAHALNPIDAPPLSPGIKKKGNKTTIKSVPPKSLAQAMLDVFADVGRHDLETAFAVILNSAANERDVTQAIERVASWIDTTPQGSLRDALQRYRDALVASGDGDGDAATTTRHAAADAVTASLLAIDVAAAAPGFGEAWTNAAEAWPEVPTDATIGAVVDAMTHAFPDGFARQRIANALARLGPKSPLYPTLRRLWESSSGQVDKFRDSLESYLDSEMKRLSGYYRRSIRTVVLALALIVAIAGGVDTFSVTRALWHNPDGRAALAHEADLLSDSGTTADQASSSGIGTIQKACEAAHPAEGAAPNSPEDAAAEYAKVRTCVGDALDNLTGLGVIDHAIWMDAGGWADDWTSGFFMHALGVVVTALALLLGAPFWFDAIKRVSGIRRGLVGDT